jgi:hypothetical protein
MDKQGAESLIELIEENHKTPRSKTTRKYISPLIWAMDNTNVIRSIKKSNTDVRENLKEKYFNISKQYFIKYFMNFL